MTQSVYMVTVNNGNDEVQVFIGTNLTDEYLATVKATWVSLEQSVANHPMYKHLITPSVLEFLGNPINGVWCWTNE